MSTSLIHGPWGLFPLKVAFVLLALPALLAGCSAGEPARESAPAGQIDGAVLDNLLNPYADQTVTLVQLDRIDRTSVLGGFTFRGVPLGVYTLTTVLPDGQSDTEVVEVKEGEITRIILQVMPLAAPEPYFEAFSHMSDGEKPERGAVCTSCEWAVPLGSDRPMEVTLEALWDSGPILGDESDRLNIVVTDGRGFQLYAGYEVASPFLVSIAGEDIHPEATELRVTARFGREFLPSTQDFQMNTVLTLYHLATKEEMFSVPA